MHLLDSELVERRQILPGQWLQTYRAPRLATEGQPGQFVHVRGADDWELLLRRPFSLNTMERATGLVTLHVGTAGRGGQALARLREGDRVEMLGPLGRPWEVDPRSRHLLLIAEGPAIAALRGLADRALESGRRVVILFGAPDAAQVYPSSLLPDEVEYAVATDDGSMGHHGRVTELVPDYEAWADQAFAAGSESLLAELARTARGRNERLGVARLGRRGGARRDPLGSAAARRKSWLQVAMRQTMGCAVGACLGCVVMGVQGPQRVCREGPVFAADEIDWDGAA